MQQKMQARTGRASDQEQKLCRIAQLGLKGHCSCSRPFRVRFSGGNRTFFTVLSGLVSIWPIFQRFSETFVWNSLKTLNFGPERVNSPERKGWKGAERCQNLWGSVAWFTAVRKCGLSGDWDSFVELLRPLQYPEINGHPLTCDIQV